MLTPPEKMDTQARRVCPLSGLPSPKKKKKMDTTPSFERIERIYMGCLSTNIGA